MPFRVGARALHVEKAYGAGVAAGGFFFEGPGAVAQHRPVAQVREHAPPHAFLVFGLAGEVVVKPGVLVQGRGFGQVVGVGRAQQQVGGFERGNGGRGEATQG